MLFGPPPEGSTPEQSQHPDEQTCPNCGADVAMITGVPYGPAPGSYPVQFEVEYPEKLSRLLIFVKIFLVIPQFLVVYALGAVIAAVTFVSFFAILFSGRYPRGLFNLVVGFTRWSANVNIYASYLRDEYPPFAMDAGLYPATFDVEYPERLSRWLIFFKWLLILPNQFIVGILGFVRLMMIFIAWWAILFTGRYPRGLFDFNVGVIRWSLRANAYAGLLRDEFPPFSMQANARPSGRTAIILSIVGAILIVVSTIGTFAAIAAYDAQTEVVVVSYARLESGFVTPTVRIEVVFEIDELADPTSLTYAPGFAQFSPFGEKVRFEFR